MSLISSVVPAGSLMPQDTRLGDLVKLLSEDCEPEIAVLRSIVNAVQVREFLATLSSSQTASLFRLLRYGMLVEDVPVINLCLMAIETKGLHQLLPSNLDCSSLLQSKLIVAYHGNVCIEKAGVTFWLPKTILDARVPYLLQLLPSLECAEDLFRCLMKYVASGFCAALSHSPVPRVARLYPLAEQIGCQMLIDEIHKHAGEKKVDWSNAPYFLELFRFVKGDLSPSLRDRLTKYALENSASDRVDAVGLFYKIHTIDREKSESLAR